MLSEDNMARVRGPNEYQRYRGQTLAQMAVAWVLRDQRGPSTRAAATGSKTSGRP